MSFEPESGPGWDGRARLDPLAAVLDPSDERGTKNRLIHAAQARALAEELRDVSGLQVLDLGCGTGRFSAWLIGRGAAVTGVDVSEPMLERARAVAPAATFVRSDGRTIPCPDASFDVVLSVGVLQYVVRDPEATTTLLSEAARVLVPGGRLVAIEQAADEPFGRGTSTSGYAEFLQRAGLAVVGKEHVRLGDSRIIARCVRHPWFARIPGTARRVVAEARAATGPFTVGRYVDELIVATKGP